MFNKILLRYKVVCSILEPTTFVKSVRAENTPTENSTISILEIVQPIEKTIVHLIICKQKA
jgi:hypothetical protein